MADPIPIIERRRIEAELLKEVYETVRARHGVDEARAVVSESVRRSAIEQARQFAAAAPGGTSLQSFVDIQSHWTAENALEIKPVFRDDTRFEFDVTRCRYAEMYRDMGLADIGPLLSCNRDGSFCEGYDPKLKFTRTQTLMQGASHCDFRYRYEETDMNPTERHAARAVAVADAVDRIRRIEARDGVNRDSLESIKAVLVELASRRELFPIGDFPPPGREVARNNALYRLSEDADHRFALYAQRSQGGTDTPAHDHTTWAIIVGVDGDELNRLYEHDGGGVRKVGEKVVGPGTGIAFLPADLHSIHIPPQTPVLNFHMYGLALEQLHGRRYYRPATHDWAHFPASEGIRDLPAPAAGSAA